MLLLEREDGGGKQEEKGVRGEFILTVRISETQIPFVRGKTYEGSQLKETRTATGLDFPPHCLQGICFSTRKMGNHRFEPSSQAEGMPLYNIMSVHFSWVKEKHFWWRRILLFPDYIFRSNLCLSIVMITVCDAYCAVFLRCIRAALLNQTIFTCSVRKVSSYF